MGDERSGQGSTGGAGMAGSMGDSVGDTMRDATSRMQQAGSNIADTGAQMSLKMLDQAERNVQEAFRAMRAAAKASDVGEVMRIQSDYMRDQSERAMTQAREIGELIAKFGRTAMGQATGRE